jgi:hypothetical protein
MADNDTQRLVTQTEAAALLQPHMPTKSALAWLENDRSHEPVIPFVSVAGGIFYRESDLLHFIGQFMEPALLHPPHDPRSGLDRRKAHERRICVEVHLRPGIERRELGGFDRRVRGTEDRRHRSPTREAAP